MKKLFGMLALVAIFSVPTLAQGTPTFEAGAGYQYRSFDVPGGGPRLNMNGWQISADANINHWLGVTADFDGTYATFGGGDNTVYSYMVGPQIYPLGHHVITPYVNVLFGGAHFGFSNCGGGGCNDSENKFAWGGGGGVDLTVSKHFAIRLAQIEYERTRFFDAGSEGIPFQDNYKIGAGLLIRFGER
jgi:opacity protein-like surface antigen